MIQKINLKHLMIKISVYNNEDGYYHEVTVTDVNTIKEIQRLYYDLRKDVNVLNSKIMDSETTQKDPKYCLKMYYDKNIQHIDITENEVCIFNCIEKEKNNYVYYLRCEDTNTLVLSEYLNTIKVM